MRDLRLPVASIRREGPAPQEKFAAGARSSARYRSQRCPTIRERLDRRRHARDRGRLWPAYSAMEQLEGWVVVGLAAVLAVPAVGRPIVRWVVQRVAAAPA